MEGGDILQTIAEVSIALTGFTGIVVALGQRSAEPLSGFALVRFRILLVASLLALGLALLPFLGHYVGLSAELTWSGCSALVAVIMIPIARFDLQVFGTYADEIPLFERRAGPFIAFVGVALWFIQVGNVFFLHDFAAFLAAPMWFLGFSALSFSRLLLTMLEERGG